MFLLLLRIQLLVQWSGHSGTYWLNFSHYFFPLFWWLQISKHFSLKGTEMWQNNHNSYIGLSFYFWGLFWQQRILRCRSCSALRRPRWHYYNKVILTVVTVNYYFSKTQYIQLPRSNNNKNGLLIYFQNWKFHITLLLAQ